MMRICKVCKIEKELESDFYRQKRCVQDRLPICKVCTQKARRHPDNLERKRLWSRVAALKVTNRFTTAKNLAKKRNLSWDISLEDFTWLCSLECYYCDGKLGHVTQGSGLDRINNDQEYTLQNVVACCRTCNNLKSNKFSLEETKTMITLVLEMRA